MERHAGAGGLEAHGQGIVRPLAYFHLSALHVLPCIRGKPPGFETDDVSHIATVETFPGRKDLEVVGCRMTGDSQILLSLPDDLMQYRRGNPVHAETADRNVISILDKSLDRFLDGRQLALQFAALLPEKLSGLVRIGIRKDPADSLCNNVH